jgi:hypothetical protein
VKVTGFVKLLARNWSKVVFSGLVLLIAIPAAHDWWKRRQIETAAKEKKQAIEQIGIDASMAGAMYAAAYKGCVKIGIPDVDQCAKYEGVLLQEKAAPRLASTGGGEANELRRRLQEAVRRQVLL